MDSTTYRTLPRWTSPVLPFSRQWVAIGMLIVTACWSTGLCAQSSATDVPPAPEATSPADSEETLEKKAETPEKTDNTSESDDSAEEAESGKEAAKDAPQEVPAPKQEKNPSKKEKATPGIAQQVLEGLAGDAEQAAANPLDNIVERMRTAQQRLKKTETDQETRKLQQQIVKDLDDLINQLKQQPPPPPQSNPNQPPPPPMGDNSQNPMPRGGPQPKPQNSQQQKSQSQNQSQQQQQQPRSGQPQPRPMTPRSQQAGDGTDSNDENLRRARTPEEEAARQRLAQDVWGHLPPALRQQLLNVYSEKFLPKYDDMVRKYYEALAEKSRQQ